MTPKQIKEYNKMMEYRKTHKPPKRFCPKCKKEINSHYGTRCYACHSVLQEVAGDGVACPTCHSQYVKRISARKRAIHGAAFGLLSKTARSQFECLSCGYKW